MIKPKGATTFAEGSPDYRTDADVIFNSGRTKRDFVLRTTKDDLAVWKTRHSKGVAGFRPKNVSPQKWAAMIDGEYWVFNIDATKAEDIAAAIKIGTIAYKTDAASLIREIFVKNLNIPDENEMGNQARIRANQKLYMDMSNAIANAAKLLGVKGTINLHVFSNKKNFKIPKDDLHTALHDGGATSVGMDTKNTYRYDVQNNDATAVLPQAITHLHLAKFNV